MCSYLSECDKWESVHAMVVNEWGGNMRGGLQGSLRSDPLQGLLGIQ